MRVNVWPAHYRSAVRRTFVALTLGLPAGLPVSLTLGGALTSHAAFAADPHWPAGSFPYTVVNQDLRSVLERFGDNIGLRVSLSDAVKGTVQGTPKAESAKDFLEQLCASYGLEWYYDGSVLNISTLAEHETKSINLHSLSFDEAKRRLTADEVLDSRYDFRHGANANVAIAAGPPSYVAFVQHEIESGIEESPDKLVVHEGGSTTIYKGPLFLPQ